VSPAIRINIINIPTRCRGKVDHLQAPGMLARCIMHNKYERKVFCSHCAIFNGFSPDRPSLVRYTNQETAIAYESELHLPLTLEGCSRKVPILVPNEVMRRGMI
jgi:hypothetical protein